MAVFRPKPPGKTFHIPAQDKRPEFRAFRQKQRPQKEPVRKTMTKKTIRQDSLRARRGEIVLGNERIKGSKAISAERGALTGKLGISKAIG